MDQNTQDQAQEKQQEVTEIKPEETKSEAPLSDADLDQVSGGGFSDILKLSKVRGDW